MSNSMNPDRFMTFLWLCSLANVSRSPLAYLPAAQWLAASIVAWPPVEVRPFARA
jgi:hypothetical protein